MMYSAKEISSHIGGVVKGDENAAIYRPAKIEEARSGDICFYNNAKYATYLETTSATAIIVPATENIAYRSEITYILVENVLVAVANLLQLFNTTESINEGIHASAVIDEDVRIGKNVRIGPHVVISKGVQIGDNTKIYGQVYLGNNVHLGSDTTLYSGCKVYHGCIIGNCCMIHANTVIGSDGFGFAPNASGAFDKIPQVGNVLIEDDVEIGANCVVDRGSMGSTIIRKGAKLDNLIQIAHNVEIGSHTVIAAQAGVAGSTKLGSYCMIGGQVGIVGHISIGDKTQVQAQSGMTKTVKESNTKWYGSPAIEYNNYLRSFAGFKNFPSLIQDIRKMKSKIEELEKRLENNG